MIADVVFDLPLDHPFSYTVPDALHLAPGQRVSAPLGGRARVGVVVALRPDAAGKLKPIQSLVEPAPILSSAGLELGRWIADESLSSWGSTLAAMLPPPPRSKRAEVLAPPAEHTGVAPSPAAELWMDAQREERLVAELGEAPGGALVIAPDTESAARWAQRLDAPRLDSGAGPGERRAAWFASARGRARVVVPVPQLPRARRLEGQHQARRVREAPLQVGRETIGWHHVEAGPGEQHGSRVAGLIRAGRERLEDADLPGDVQVVGAGREAGLGHGA